MNKQIMLLAVLSFISCGQEGTGSSNSSIKLNSSSESDVTRNPHIDKLNLKSFSKRNKRPSRLDSRYYSIVEHRGDKGLELVVSGVEINLEVGSHQGLYEQLHNRSDISQLIIQAEKITLNSPLQVGGSDIIINAKNLIFNEGGKLVTTPVSMHAPIAQQYQDGIDGEDGGSIELNVENIVTFDDQIILVTDGGNGQDAGPGSNGARGTNAHLYHGYYAYYRERCRERLVGPRGGRKGSYLCSTLKNFNGRPSGNGQNARVGGRPGEAGSAGEIKYLKKMNLSKILLQT